MATAPPGWFPDQTDPSRLRYWDGANWTEHTHALPQGPAGASVGEKPSNPRPVRGWMRRHKLLTVLGALVLIGLIGAVLPDPEDTAEESRSVAAVPPPAPSSSDPTPTEPAPEATTEPPVEPSAAPEPTQKEIWGLNYATEQDGYLGAVAVALALSSAPSGSDVSAVKACGEAKKGLPLPKRVARFARRASTGPTVDQSIAALDATVSLVCPEFIPTHTEQVAVRAASIQRAQQAAAEKARQQKAAAAAKAEQQKAAAAAAAKAEQQREQEEQQQANVYYDNCTDVEAAGAAPIYAGDPGYSRDLDRDGDGVACET